MSAEVRGSLASLIFERTRIQNMDYSRGTHTAFLSSNTMKDEASPVEDIESFTQRMLALITKRTAQMTSVRKDGRTSSTTKINPPTTAVPAQAIEGHSSSSSKGNAEEATSTSEESSTDNQQTMGKVAATCKKDGGKSPVMTTVLAVTSKEPSEKQHWSTLHSKSSQEERKSPRLDVDKTVDDLDQLPCVFGEPKHIPERDQLERSTESVEGARFDKVHGLAENVQTKSVPVKKTFEPQSQNYRSENGKNELAQQNSSLTDGNKMDSSVGKVQIDDDQCVPSNKIRAVGDKESVKEIAHNAEYEDISETSEPETNCNAYSEGLNCPSWYKELQFEDISGESENEAMGKPSFSLGLQDTQSDGEQMLCKQSVTHMKQESIPDEKLIEKSVSPKTVAFDQVHHASYSFCNETENEETDDEWIVIPVTISDLRYEPGSEDQEGVGKVQLDEVTETQCNRNQTLWSGRSRSTPDCQGDNDGEPVPQKSSEQNSKSDDSSDTEDSCDYPIESKSNHMTVSGLFFRKSPALLTPAPFVTMVETDGQQDKNVPNCQTTDLNKMTEKLRQILQAKAGIKQKTSGKNISKKQHVTFIDSDSDEEIRQRRRKKVKRRFSLRSESSEDSSCSQNGKHSPERVDTHKDSLLSIDLKPLQCCSTLGDTQSREEVQTKAEPESVQHETEKHIALNKDAKTAESNLGSKTDQNCEQGAKKRRFKHSEDRGDPLCTVQVAPQQQSTLHGDELKETIQDPCSDQQTETKVDSEFDRHKVLNEVVILDSDTEDESDYNLKNTAKKKRISSSSSTHKVGSTCINQPQSQQLKLHDEEFKRALSSKTDSEPIQHKADMQKISTTGDVIIILSDSDDDSGVNDEKRNNTMLVTSGLAGCHDTTCAAEEKCKGTTLPFANSSLPKHSYNHHDTQSNKPEQDMCSRWTNRENMSQIKAKDSFENVQHRTNRLKVSDKTKVLTDANKEHRKKHLCKKVSFKKRILPSSSDSNSETDFSSEERLSPEPQGDHHETATRKPEACRQFYKELSKKLPPSMDKGTDSVLGSNPVIPSLLVSNPDQIHGRLRLTSLPPGSSNVCGQILKKSSMAQATIVKPPLVSRQLSFPPSVRLSTSSSDISSSNGPRREAKRILVPSSDLPSSGVFREVLNHSRSRQNTYITRPTLTSARAKPSNLYRSPTTPDQICSPTECPSYSPTLTRTRILESWKSTFPNKGEVRRRRRRFWMDDNLGTTCLESSKEVIPRPSHDAKKEVRPGHSGDPIEEVRPGPSHSYLSGTTRPVPSRSDPLRAARPESRGHKRRVLRIRSLETTAPLMKKTKNDYSQLPKATNRDPAQGQSYPVGENYKWGQPKQGPSNSRKGKQC